MLLLRSANDRTLTHFVAQVQDETIRSALRYYTLEGVLGQLLDAEEDGLAEAHSRRLRDRGADGAEGAGRHSRSCSTCSAASSDR